ncbi:MAG: structural cement protein Gp24 [Alphaproteobacteria bacterium]
MSVQTSYGQYPAIGVAGQKADSSHWDAWSKVASIPLFFGRVVAVDGTSATKVKLPNNSADKLVGVAMRSHVYPSDVPASADIETGKSLAVMHFGEIYVKTETAVVVGDPVHVRYATGAGGTDLGSVRNATVASETIAWTDAEFSGNAAAGQIVKIRIKK